MHLRQSCPAPATDGALGSCRTTRQGRERDAHDATAGCVPLRGPSGPQQGRGGRAAGTETLLSGQGQRIWEDDRCLTSPGARLVAGMSLDWSGLEDETQLSTLDALEKRMGHTSQGLSHMHELLEYLLSKMTEGREDARQHTRSLCRKLIRNHMETYTALATLRSVLTEVARTDNAKSAILDALETIVGKVEPLGPRPGTGPCAESNATGNAALPCYGLASSFLASLRRDCRGPSVFESDPVGAGAGGSGGGADTQSVESSLRSPAPRDAPIDWLSLSDAETVVHRSGVEDGVSDDASSQSDDNSNSNSNSNVPSYPTEPPSRHLHRRRRSTGAIQTPSSAAELRKETPHTSLQPLQRALSELISAGADARVIREGPEKAAFNDTCSSIHTAINCASSAASTPPPSTDVSAGGTFHHPQQYHGGAGTHLASSSDLRSGSLSSSPASSNADRRASACADQNPDLLSLGKLGAERVTTPRTTIRNKRHSTRSSPVGGSSSLSSPVEPPLLNKALDGAAAAAPAAEYSPRPPPGGEAAVAAATAAAAGGGCVSSSAAVVPHDDSSSASSEPRMGPRARSDTKAIRMRKRHSLRSSLVASHLRPLDSSGARATSPTMRAAGGGGSGSGSGSGGGGGGSLPKLYLLDTLSSFAPYDAEYVESPQNRILLPQQHSHPSQPRTRH